MWLPEAERRESPLESPLLPKDVGEFPEEPRRLHLSRPWNTGELSSPDTHVLQKARPKAVRGC